MAHNSGYSRSIIVYCGVLVAYDFRLIDFQTLSTWGPSKEMGLGLLSGRVIGFGQGSFRVEIR